MFRVAPSLEMKKLETTLRHKVIKAILKHLGLSLVKSRGYVTGL